MALLLSALLLMSVSFTALAEGYFDNNAGVGDILEDEVSATVYVSDSGNDNGAGTEDSPYKTLNKAIKSVYHNGTVVIVDTVTLASNFSFEKTGKTVTITGGTLNASAKNRVILQNNTIFDNITLTFANGTKLFANGYKLTMGENVTMSNATYSGSTDLWVYGGGQEGTTVKSTDVTILGGVYSRVYGGSYGGTVTGDTNLTVGGNVNPDLDITSHSSLCNFYGGGQSDTINGDTNFTFGGNARGSYLFGASENASALSGKTATVGGTANLKITGGKAYSIYGGSNNVNHKSDVNLTITGGEFSQIFGGCQNESLTGNVKMDIAGATVKRRIYGGCYNETSGFSGFSTSRHVTGNIDLTIRGTANITFSDSDDDRSIYGHSRHKTNHSDEISTIVFADATAYSKYKDKLQYQDNLMGMFMGSLSAADYIHYFTYSANDTTDVISTSCSYHSGESETATLTLDNSISRVYNGKEIEAAKVVYSSGWKGDTAEVVYSNNINAGTASAKLSLGGASVTLDYTIEKATQKAPYDFLFSTTAETVKGKADGKISGLTAGMDISSDNVSFAPVTDLNASFAAGTYYVRYSETANYKPSSAVAVTVDSGRALVVTFLVDGEEYETREVQWNGTLADIPEAPHKEGYDQVAPTWDVTDFSGITSDMVANAVYTINTYTITFLVDGEEYATRQVQWNGTLADIPEIPHKEGYDQVDPAWDVTDFSGIKSDMVVNAVYTLNKLVVTFVDKNGETFFTAYVEQDGDVSAEDLQKAMAAVPVFYGYDFVGWNKEVVAIVEDTTVEAVYERQTKTYGTTLNTVGGQTQSREVQFDQRFTLVDEAANSFLVDGQIIGGAGRVSLYGCGEITIDASESVAPDEVSVAILKTVTNELLGGKNAYRVFVHVYNPTEAKTSSVGVMFAPGSAYTTDDRFKMEALDENKYIILEAQSQAEDLLATFKGITTASQVTRVVRAYAVQGDTTVYSNRVYSHTFN